jgi:nucleoside-diphosphate-sugar epimerase
MHGKNWEDRSSQLQVSKVNQEHIILPSERILVTGSNGFIGTRVVDALLRYGFSSIRCFVRPSSRLDGLYKVLDRYSPADTVELLQGDLLSSEDCQQAADGCAIVYHLAAGSDKSFAGSFMNSVLATRNLMDAAVARGELKRFVNVSSFAVYSTLKIQRRGVLDETCPLEDSPQERYDPYVFGKLKQEELVKEYGKRFGLPYVILRPGTVFGPGKRELSRRVGIGTFGVFIQVGGSNLVPLTFVDNCAEAIVLAGLKPGVEGEVFNVVDDELLTSGQFLSRYKKSVKQFLSVRIPYFAAHLFCLLWENYSRKSKSQLPPVFNRRRCAAEWKQIRFTNQRLRDRLGWEPRIGLESAMSSFLSQFTDR